MARTRHSYAFSRPLPRKYRFVAKPNSDDYDVGDVFKVLRGRYLGRHGTIVKLGNNGVHQVLCWPIRKILFIKATYLGVPEIIPRKRKEPDEQRLRSKTLHGQVECIFRLAPVVRGDPDSSGDEYSDEENCATSYQHWMSNRAPYPEPEDVPPRREQRFEYFPPTDDEDSCVNEDDDDDDESTVANHGVNGVNHVTNDDDNNNNINGYDDDDDDDDSDISDDSDSSDDSNERDESDDSDDDECNEGCNDASNNNNEDNDNDGDDDDASDYEGEWI